ncbi:hypothetical protein GOP47_0004953 [Adiantum capillus-veneris]|uniref:COBRA-like protein n=1 Tax=Adiantum capillus-veneris TaxID=13818 RepID=A0A9D4V4N5_ADICA|nr:hypothetical protein GOP47_0004953 [Adiantum capillus-veneris]
MPITGSTMPPCGAPFSHYATLLPLLFALFPAFLLAPSYGYDVLDPNGNITIKWDVTSWTGDGYVATVTMYNYQQYRHVESPGWILGWRWQRKEVIWSMVGAQATLQGDCSKFHSAVPHCCLRNPSIVDLLPGVPYNSQVANCCRGGVLTSWGQDPANAVSSFQISVGLSGNTNTSVKVPKNFTLQTPGPGYSCGPAKTVKPTLFNSGDGRRKTQALMTWSLVCTYSEVMAHRAQPCCVSFSSFYNETIVPCPACACGCENKDTCYETAPLKTVTSGSNTGVTPQAILPKIHCTKDMCPVRLHWHVKQNYKDYWRVKLTISNRNYAQNYSQWNAVVQHPNFDNLTEVFSFTYKSLNPYGDAINDTAMLWGIKYYNDLLMQAGEEGNVQSEILFQKDRNTFSFTEGWAFPLKVYFNGDSCVLPSPDAYPRLPNGARPVKVETSMVVLLSLMVAAFLGFLW